MLECHLPFPCRNDLLNDVSSNSLDRRACHTTQSDKKMLLRRIFEMNMTCSSTRPICTRCCQTMTNMIQACVNFYWARVFIIDTRPDKIPYRRLLKCIYGEPNYTEAELGCAARFLFSRCISFSRLLAETYLVLRRHIQIRKSSADRLLKYTFGEPNLTETEPEYSKCFVGSRCIISNRLLAEAYIVLRKRVSGDSGAKGEGGKEMSGSAMTPDHTP